MTTKVVIRIVDATNQVLGWTEASALAKGDGYLRARDPIVVAIEHAGTAAEVSIHWCDVNVETRVPFGGNLRLGAIVSVFPSGAPLVCVGPMPQALPAVTVREPMTMRVPVGQLGTVGTR